MGFEARTDSIRSFADRVDGLGQDVPNATSYINTHLDIGYADARLFATIAAACDSAREALLTSYEHLRSISEESAAELRGAATMYDDTDEDEARRLDATYAG
ncbi:type VII secretion target [Actinoalloteichus spitiensis]|uniref:type VII secretion target n=1 Tax=Actinoalloteichus spitiensis TaxID=252394 RepID=UPI0002DC29C3|nr:type VII secretion target [Actinoalloteichus spitiensis]